ncbi:hypothetical protein J2P12_07860, partial [Candidatus Bathyarchaeota archaeon]|nr:hypothetical protein [Candidatus Bathyarchaeota archaeon]
FLGEGSVRLVRECLNAGLIEERQESKLIPRSYWSVWAAINRARRRIGLDPKIQPCHGFRKYFENALDEANIDHEKKMVIEGHFAGTRAKHYTDRDVEQLRGVYRRVYPFVRLSVDDQTRLDTQHYTYDRKIADIEARLDRQRFLEAKLAVLEDELERVRQSRM